MGGFRKDVKEPNTETGKSLSVLLSLYGFRKDVKEPNTETGDRQALSGRVAVSERMSKNQTLKLSNARPASQSCCSFRKDVKEPNTETRPETAAGATPAGFRKDVKEPNTETVIRAAAIDEWLRFRKDVKEPNTETHKKPGTQLFRMVSERMSKNQTLKHGKHYLYDVVNISENAGLSRKHTAEIQSRLDGKALHSPHSLANQPSDVNAGFVADELHFLHEFQKGCQRTKH